MLPQVETFMFGTKLLKTMVQNKIYCQVILCMFKIFFMQFHLSWSCMGESCKFFCLICHQKIFSCHAASKAMRPTNIKALSQRAPPTLLVLYHTTLIPWIFLLWLQINPEARSQGAPPTLLGPHHAFAISNNLGLSTNIPNQFLALSQGAPPILWAQGSGSSPCSPNSLGLSPQT